ncbi:hypothetical protein EDC01DRAFT_655880 [Geopyxis carbonaria]|nr:hypothetical protein EDC01DRAFT_655880 [Geopyxis carbonaria]
MLSDPSLMALLILTSQYRVLASQNPPQNRPWASRLHSAAVSPHANAATDNFTHSAAQMAPSAPSNRWEGNDAGVQARLISPERGAVGGFPCRNLRVLSQCYSSG